MSPTVPVLFRLLFIALTLAGALTEQAMAYPKINSDGTVEFTYRAPKAARITVSGDMGSAPLVARGDGTWSATLGPLAPELYRYVFYVDDVRAPDQDNLNVVTGYGAGSPMSFFEVPGDGSEAFQYRPDMNYGRIERVDYYSPVLKRMRQMHVFTPREYEVREGRGGWRKFPVLYLLGGVGESDSQWSSIGRAGVILQNLIEDGLVKPMIVVMLNGRIDEPGQVNPTGVDIGDELLDAVIPYVDAHYRTKTGRQQRALAGLSLRGFTVLQHGFTHLDRFAYLGVFSSAVFGGTDAYEAANRSILIDPATNQRLKLFWFGMGRQDFLYQSGADTRAMFDEYGIKYTYYENAYGHDWFSWKDYLARFAPLLFR
jgi:enterochelin esterase family protein